MIKVGCDNLVYAIMTGEDTATSAPTYAAIKTAPGVMSVNINPNGSIDTCFADDGPFESATTLGKIEVEIQKAYLTTENKADLLGKTIDANGALIHASNDTPPYVAVGFRSLKSNGAYRYVWLYKGRFLDPEDNNETRGESINFQSDTLKGQFAKLDYPVTIGGKKKYAYKYELDEDHPGANASVMTNWFNSVVMPSAGNAAPSLTVAWAAGTASKATKATITGSAGASNHYAYKVSNETPGTIYAGVGILGSTSYTSAADIPGVAAGKWVTIYELTADCNVVKGVTHQLISSEVAV